MTSWPDLREVRTAIVRKAGRPAATLRRQDNGTVFTYLAD